MRAMLALALFAATAAAQDSFQESLAPARVHLDRRRFDRARTELVAAIENAPDRVDVARNWAELSDDLTTAAFWSTYEAPEPADVVSGDLLSYDESSGNIKLRYRGDVGDQAWKEDFTGANNFYVHPLLFKGPYSVELRGKKLGGGTGLPMILVGYDWNTLYGVAFGDVTTAFRWEDGAFSRLDDCTVMLKNHRGYSFRVNLAASSVAASYNNKRLLKVKRPKGDFGQFGFSNFSGLEEVLISGTAEPSWISGKIDAEVNTAWVEFVESYDPLEEVPGWVAELVRGDFEDAKQVFEACPQPATRIDRDALKTVSKLKSGTVAKLAPPLINNTNGISENARQWCLSIVSALSGDFDKALRQCDRVIHGDPEFIEARLFRVTLIQATGSKEQARTELEGVLADFPDNVAPYRELARQALFAERYDQARDTVAAGIDAGIPAEAFATVELNRLRAIKGPKFSKTYSYQSKHYSVVSDMGRKTCFQVAEELEKFYLKYNTHVHRLKRDKRKFKVYVFSGLAGYTAYCRDLFGEEPESELGRYSLALKQLLIWNSPDRRLMMRTVRHEGFHQYLDRLSGEAPIWLHEGMAEYFEQSRIVRGRWKDDQLNEQHLTLLKRKRPTPLDEFVRLDARAFRAETALHYAQGWAFIHFLLQGDHELKPRFEKLMDALANGAAQKEAVDQAFEGVDWDATDREFRSYVAGLK